MCRSKSPPAEPHFKSFQPKSQTSEQRSHVGSRPQATPLPAHSCWSYHQKVFPTQAPDIREQRQAVPPMFYSNSWPTNLGAKWIVPNATQLEGTLERSNRQPNHALSAGATATQLQVQTAPRLAKYSDLFVQNNWKTPGFFPDFEMLVNISKNFLKYSAEEPNPTWTSLLAHESASIWDNNQLHNIADILTATELHILK